MKTDLQAARDALSQEDIDYLNRMSVRDELECEHCGRTRNPEDDGWCWYCLSGDTSEPLGTPEDTQP